MRTYEDTFSGDKIYPGKVRLSVYNSGGESSTKRLRVPRLSNFGSGW
jgi:ribosomal protein L24E